MSGSKADKHVNMVGYTANSFGNNIQSFGCATQITVKARTPGRLNQWPLIFGPKNDVDMQTKMG